MADTTSLSALPQHNDVQNSENITLQTNEISSQGGVNGGGQPVQSSMQEPQPTNTKQANPLQYVPPNSQQQQPPEQLSQNMINQVITVFSKLAKLEALNYHLVIFLLILVVLLKMNKYNQTLFLR